MPRAGAGKRKRGATQEDQAQDRSSTPEIVAARPARRKARHVSLLEEYNEDPGRDGSRNFLDWATKVEEKMKKDTFRTEAFLKDFRQKNKVEMVNLREQKKELMNQLIQERDTFLSDFQNLCSEALQTSSSSGKTKPSRISRKEDHVLYQDAQIILSRSSAMLQEFKEMDERLQNRKPEFPLNAWKEDKASTKKMLASGRQRAEELVECLLVPNKYPTPKADKHGDVDASLLPFEGANRALEGKTWGVTAVEQAGQLTNIVKRLFPEDAA